MPSQSTEGGLRRHRIEFVREVRDANGDCETPDDPDWEPYSDNLRSFEWSPGAGVEEQRGVGSADPSNHHKGPEEHQLSVVYDLQRWLIDGSGDPQDAVYDGLARDAANKLHNTHSVLDREDKTNVAQANLVDSSPTPNTRDVRVYTYAYGGHIATASLTGDPSDQQPVGVEMEYEFEKVRTVQIDQPSAAQELAVENLGSSSVDVTIEDEGASTSETVTVANGATEPTTATFADIDAVELSTDVDGDVNVYLWDTGGSATEDLLAVIPGSDSYGDVEGDIGIPALGTGSRASAIGSAYETILGDTITRGGSALAYDVNSKAIEVDNNVERTVRSETVKQRVHVGDRTTTVTATVLGETESQDKILDALTVNEADIVWTLTGGTITVPDAALMSPGSRTVEQGQAAMTLDNEFNGSGVTVA